MNLCFSIHSLQQLVFQDEKGFSLQVPTNRQNLNGLFQWYEKDVKPEHLYTEVNKFPKKGYGICCDNLERS